MGNKDTRRSLKHLLCPLLLATLNLAAPQSAAVEPFTILSQNMNRLFDDSYLLLTVRLRQILV